jgi:hypothetical protein
MVFHWLPHFWAQNNAPCSANVAHKFAFTFIPQLSANVHPLLFLFRSKHLGNPLHAQLLVSDINYHMHSLTWNGSFVCYCLLRNVTIFLGHFINVILVNPYTYVAAGGLPAHLPFTLARARFAMQTHTAQHQIVLMFIQLSHGFFHTPFPFLTFKENVRENKCCTYTHKTAHMKLSVPSAGHHHATMKGSRGVVTKKCRLLLNHC